MRVVLDMTKIDQIDRQHAVDQLTSMGFTWAFRWHPPEPIDNCVLITDEGRLEQGPWHFYGFCYQLKEFRLPEDWDDALLYIRGQLTTDVFEEKKAALEKEFKRIEAELETLRKQQWLRNLSHRIGKAYAYSDTHAFYVRSVVGEGYKVLAIHFPDNGGVICQVVSRRPESLFGGDPKEISKETFESLYLKALVEVEYGNHF